MPFILDFTSFDDWLGDFVRSPSVFFFATLLLLLGSAWEFGVLRWRIGGGSMVVASVISWMSKILGEETDILLTRFYSLDCSMRRSSIESLGEEKDCAGIFSCCSWCFGVGMEEEEGVETSALWGVSPSVIGSKSERRANSFMFFANLAKKADLWDKEGPVVLRGAGVDGSHIAVISFEGCCCWCSEDSSIECRLVELLSGTWLKLSALTSWT